MLSFINNNSPNACKNTHVKSLMNKTIVIDASMLLYQFKIKNKLISNLFLLCTTFRYYNITPIFVFDGKPPKSKESSIEMRKTKKEKFYKEYKDIEQQLNNNHDNVSKNTKSMSVSELKKKMNILKSKCTYITKVDIENVKQLFNLYGIHWIQSVGEADVVCAYLMEKNVYAVMSDDTDMFGFGCKNVIRSYNITTNTFDMYSLSRILNDTELTKDEFSHLCSLCKTDYYNVDEVGENKISNMNVEYEKLKSLKQSEIQLSKEIKKTRSESTSYYHNIFDLKCYDKEINIHINVNIPDLKNMSFKKRNIVQFLKRFNFYMVSYP